MAASIDATVGGANANSYATVADADSYFETRLNADAWETDASADDKVRALIQATYRLDQEDYEGDKAASGQALKWPRVNALDEDGDEYASDAIPTPIERATYEVALWFLNEGTSDPLSDTGLDAFEEVEVDVVRVVPRLGHRDGGLPENVERLLDHILISMPLISHVSRGQVGFGTAIRNVADTVVGAFPDTGTLGTRTGGSYDTETGQMVGVTSASVSVQCKIGRYRDSEIGGPVQVGDIPVFLPARQVTTDPDVFETFTKDGTTYQIQEVERIYADDVVVAYRLRVRR